MPVKWVSTKMQGVRYYEHTERRMRNGQPDRYYAIRYSVNGKRHEEGLGWASEGWNPEKAYSVLAKLKAGIRDGTGPQSLAEGRAQKQAAEQAAAKQAQMEALASITLGEFLREHYMPRAKREKRSWRIDEQRIAKAIDPALGNVPLRALRREDVQGFVDGLVDGGAAPATVKQYRDIIRRAYNIARETSVDGITLHSGDNPATGISLPAVKNARERYLTGAEVEALLTYAKGLRSPDLHDAMLLSLHAGLRLGEISRLRWVDVDFAAGIITVPDEARRKPGGKVPMNDTTRAVLESRHHAGPGLVFPPRAGVNVRVKLTKLFTKAALATGINDGITDARHKAVFHTLRHTFASWLALAGVDIYRIKTLMRHKNIAMTMRYAHLIPDETRDAVQHLTPPPAR